MNLNAFFFGLLAQISRSETREFEIKTTACSKFARNEKKSLFWAFEIQR